MTGRERIVAVRRVQGKHTPHAGGIPEETVGLTVGFWREVQGTSRGRFMGRRLRQRAGGVSAEREFSCSSARSGHALQNTARWRSLTVRLNSLAPSTSMFVDIDPDPPAPLSLTFMPKFGLIMLIFGI